MGLNDFNLDHEKVKHVERKVEAHDMLLSTMSVQVQEIHVAMLGTFDKEGLVSRVRTLEKTARRRRTPEWLEHAFKAVTAGALAYLGVKGVE